MDKTDDSDKNQSAAMELVKTPDPFPEHLEQEVKLTKCYLAEQHAPSTRRAYRADWKIFEA